MPGTNEALADAFSGVVGTLVSLWCFYPIERLKTNVQAGTAPSSLSSSSSSSSSSSRTYDVETIVKLLRQSFRGCGTKSLHATASSFCYFYCYSWILSAYHARRRKGVIDAPQLRPSTGLVLAAIAAMMNTLVTLPLDVLSSQRTVGKEEEEEKSGAAKLGTTARGTKSTTAAATTATATATTTTTTTTKSTKPADSAEESSSDTQAQAAMAKAWNSIGKREKPTETETENPYRKATTASTSLTSSSSSSSSPESSVVELVFHEACGCSEDLFSLRRDSSGTGSNDDSNNHDHDHDHDPNTSRCSSGGSSHSRLSQNEEYMARWRERQLQRREDRGRRSRQQQQQQPLRLRLPSDARNSALRFLRRWSRLWKGLAPALLLCSNPSIHYTVFDVLKTKMLAYKRTNNRNNHRAPKLSVSDAFVLGLLSKFVATIVTYPLIRAKVLMMVRGDDNDDETSSDNDNDNDNDTERPLRTSTSSSSLVSVLQQSYHRDGGLKGLYKGCDWQLIHTLLKSALMMAIREQITGTSRALFRVPVPVPAAVAVARKNNTVASSSS